MYFFFTSGTRLSFLHERTWGMSDNTTVFLSSPIKVSGVPSFRRLVWDNKFHLLSPASGAADLDCYRAVKTTLITHRARIDQRKDQLTHTSLIRI